MAGDGSQPSGPKRGHSGAEDVDANDRVTWKLTREPTGRAQEFSSIIRIHIKATRRKQVLAVELANPKP